MQKVFPSLKKNARNAFAAHTQKEMRVLDKTHILNQEPLTQCEKCEIVLDLDQMIFHKRNNCDDNIAMDQAAAWVFSKQECSGKTYEQDV
jgi:hypothetical protein